jgi:hypothetical protein
MDMKPTISVGNAMRVLHTSIVSTTYVAYNVQFIIQQVMNQKVVFISHKLTLLTLFKSQI